MRRGGRTTGDDDPELDAEDSTIPRAVAPKAPMRAISLKTPGAGTKKVARPAPEVRLAPTPPHVQTPPPPVGRLAPPRDAGEVRSRRLRDVVLWGSLTVILASLVTLVIWLVAGR